ncbi:hypothetical protein LPJ53_004539 [Coemansia erecta]|uniref:Mediator of RNA polymerase II transcription subunit 9 n=1 Tax=Coemansia erecta TaxID=147472 RepID=A0A9W8CRI4_9FUNG|nr:hypothetical protein LPJ53_004539 [Coemansia erecta]
MDAVFDKLDASVTQALQTLFPPTSAATTPTAQQRAHDFAAHVSLAHAHLADLRSAADGTRPTLGASGSDEHVEVAREIEDIRADIRRKDEVLERHRGMLGELGQKLRRMADENAGE